MLQLLLVFLLFIVVAVLFIGLSIVGTILRGLFGIGRRQQHHSDEESNHIRYKRKAIHPEGKKRVFAKDEGDYVDFEEVKDAP